jgi:pimeloyl-ACP methyl ester carboxylesterase
MLIASPLDGTRLFALEAGEGEPALVFIHGNGADHTAWHHQIRFFSRTRRVVAVDLRGHGRSGRDPQERYVQDTFVADVLAVVREMGGGPSVLVGWSMAGSIASRIAVEHPELVAGVVFVDHNVQAAKAELGLESGPWSSAAILRGLEEDFQGRGFRRMVDSWFPETGPRIDALKQWLWEIGMQAGRATVLGIRQVGVKEDRRHWLRQMRTPALVLQGADSYIGGRAVGEYLHSLVQGSEFHAFDGHGHAVFLTAPDEFNRALDDWVARVATAARS